LGNSGRKDKKSPWGSVAHSIRVRGGVGQTMGNAREVEFKGVVNVGKGVKEKKNLPDMDLGRLG